MGAVLGVVLGTVGACIADAAISAAAAAAASAAAAGTIALSVAEEVGLIQTLVTVAPFASATFGAEGAALAFIYTPGLLAEAGYFGGGIAAFAELTTVVTPLGYAVAGGLVAGIGGATYGIIHSQLGGHRPVATVEYPLANLLSGKFCTFFDYVNSNGSKLQCGNRKQQSLRLESGRKRQSSMSPAPSQSMVRRVAKHVRNKKSGSTKSRKVAQPRKRLR